MICSMTAFASGQLSDANRALAIEIRSYNSRHLDLVVWLPHGYRELENVVRQLVADRLARGRVEIKVDIEDHAQNTELFVVDARRALAYRQALRQLAAVLDLDADFPLALVAGVDGVIAEAVQPPDADSCRPLLQACLGQALDELVAMRVQEGRFMADDLVQRLDLLETQTQRIAEASRNLLLSYQERLKQRIRTLTEGIIDLAPERLAQEAALLAERSDISEEIVRLQSHFQQFRELVQSPAPAGRKLNFLLQEMNRELNTLGSKTSRADVAHRVVDMKSELEKIREQVQNVE